MQKSSAGKRRLTLRSKKEKQNLIRLVGRVDSRDKGTNPKW